jgi:hypothetical protein
MSTDEGVNDPQPETNIAEELAAAKATISRIEALLQQWKSEPRAGTADHGWNKGFDMGHGAAVYALRCALGQPEVTR